MLSQPDPRDLCGCKEMMELVKKKKIRYEWFVCNCSPAERSYQIRKENSWKPLNKCPYCEKPIPMFGTVKIFPSIRKCPKCGEEFDSY